MNNLEFLKYQYYLKSSKDFFKINFQNRLKFLKQKRFLFKELAFFINNCIDSSKKIFIFCAGNSIISKYINSKKIFVREIDQSYQIKYKDNINYVNDNIENSINECDTILISDIEHQQNPAINLLHISKIIKDDVRLIVISRNLIWMTFIKLLKKIYKFSPNKNNFLPSSYLENLYTSCNLEIIRSEKIIALPIYIPFLTNIINKIFRLPFLNIFCLSNMTILKKKDQSFSNNNDLKVSFIVPCKNEESNIGLFEKEILNSSKMAEYFFGDDKSSDNTLNEISKLSKKLSQYKIYNYSGPGVCKSENVYRGIEKCNGDIVVIYDADLTVSFRDVEFSIEVLKNTNADFINCTRMIYPQKDGAMKIMNFIGNIFFASIFSLLFKKKITDTLCGTKIFYKKDWNKIKKNNSKWGMKDLWGDFDLLIGAYKNNLKITEVPVTYYSRKADDTKMTSVISNGLRMLIIVLTSYYKLRLK